MSVEESDLHADRLYREMKATPGGVMLLVRLRADLAAESPESLRRLRTFDLNPNVLQLPDKPRLAVTYSWLERQYGEQNAARAVVETAAAILRDAVAEL
jgi:hypothetical protein